MLDINKLYKIMADQMERLRVADTKPYSEEYREIDETKLFKLEEGYSSTELRTIMENLPEGTVSIKGHTRVSGRHDFFSHLTIAVTTYKKLEKIEPLHVKRMLQPIIAKQLGMYSWQTPDCRILELYKDGSITWEECVKAHNVSC